MINRLLGSFFFLMVLMGTFFGCAHSPDVPFSNVKINENTDGFHWKPLGNNRYEGRLRYSRGRWNEQKDVELYENMCKVMKENGLNWMAIENEFNYRGDLDRRVLGIVTVKGFKDLPSQIQKFIPIREELLEKETFYETYVKDFKELHPELKEKLCPKGNLWAVSNVVDVKSLLSSKIVASENYFQLSPLYAYRSNWFLYNDKNKKYIKTVPTFYYSYNDNKNALLTAGSGVYIKSIDDTSPTVKFLSQDGTQPSKVGSIFELPAGPHKIIVGFNANVSLDFGSAKVSYDITNVIGKDGVFEINAVDGVLYYIFATPEETKDKNTIIHYALKEIPMEFVK